MTREGHLIEVYTQNNSLYGPSSIFSHFVVSFSSFERVYALRILISWAIAKLSQNLGNAMVVIYRFTRKQSETIKATAWDKRNIECSTIYIETIIKCKVIRKAA